MSAGAQVRGATTHYDAVVGAATSGCLNASTDTGEGQLCGDRFVNITKAHTYSRQYSQLDPAAEQTPSTQHREDGYAAG